LLLFSPLLAAIRTAFPGAIGVAPPLARARSLKYIPSVNRVTRSWPSHQRLPKIFSPHSSKPIAWGATPCSARCEQCPITAPGTIGAIKQVSDG
jgi:hypothetical protein